MAQFNEYKRRGYTYKWNALDAKTKILQKQRKSTHLEFEKFMKPCSSRCPPSQNICNNDTRPADGRGFAV